MSDFSRRRFLEQLRNGAMLAGASAAGLGILTKPAQAATQSRVVVVTGKDPRKMLEAAMRVFHGMDGIVKGKKVALKPNMSFKNPAAWGNNTNPLVAQAVAEMCQAGGATSVIAVDHTMGQAGASINACGVGPALAKVKGVEVISADKKAQYVSRRVPKGKQLKSTEVPKDVAACEVLINIPVAKQHNATKVSFGLKNLMGLVWDRRHFHEMINLHQGIADLATVLTPQLTIIDATRVMTNNGPQGPGKVEVLDTLVVSTDPVAADAVALGLTSWNSEKLEVRAVEHIRAAGLLGLGQADVAQIKVIRKRV